MINYYIYLITETNDSVCEFYHELLMKNSMRDIEMYFCVILLAVVINNS